MRNFVVARRQFGGIPDFDNLFNSLFAQNGCGNIQSDFRPAVDVNETENEISLTVELPGMEKEEIKIWVENETLTISGERKLGRPEDNSGQIRTEIRSGKFSRSFNLAESIDSEKISADYKNGVLYVTLQKEEKAKPKEIKVNIS